MAHTRHHPRRHAYLTMGLRYLEHDLGHEVWIKPMTRVTLLKRTPIAGYIKAPVICQDDNDSFLTVKKLWVPWAWLLNFEGGRRRSPHTMRPYVPVTLNKILRRKWYGRHDILIEPQQAKLVKPSVMGKHGLATIEVRALVIDPIKSVKAFRVHVTYKECPSAFRRGLFNNHDKKYEV